MSILSKLCLSRGQGPTSVPQLMLFLSRRNYSKSDRSNYSFKNRTAAYYLTSIILVFGGLTYAAVPLYRAFCQSMGLGGQASLLGITENPGDKVASMKAVPHREITVRFEADTSSGIKWNFRPQQTSIRVRPGETALAFYVAKNPYKEPIDGIATYNVLPFEAGKYFNKIQCFCFEEQRLNPGEEVDMPVFFYIDPDYANDPLLENVNDITLSYTFFKSKPGLKLPIPQFA